MTESRLFLFYITTGQAFNQEAEDRESKERTESNISHFE